jgi:phage-related protein
MLRHGRKGWSDKGLRDATQMRVKDHTGAYRAFYFTRSSRGILVLHAFAKRSQGTPAIEIKLGRKRLKELLNETS